MSGIDTAGYPRDTLSSIVVGLYAWVLAASFGAAVLDVVYAKTIAGIVDSAQTVRIFSEVSDFLLLPLAGALTGMRPTYTDPMNCGQYWPEVDSGEFSH